MTKTDLKKIKLPDSPGVYFFKKGRQILYIGRATSLRDRVKSYFSDDLIGARGPIVVDMVTEATDISHKKTGSVMEAVILEANLIKKHQPIYNTKEKDNRSWNYVVISEEKFPRVLIVRGRNIDRNIDKSPETLGYPMREVFGPYPLGSMLRVMLSIIRKMFPYRDTCSPYTPAEMPAKPTKPAKLARPCFNRQINLCPGICTGEISPKEYQKTIKRISLLLRGNITGLKRLLKKEMHDYASAQDFEMAGKAKKALYGLDHIQDIALIKDELRSSANKSGFRIEAYDIAHTSGRDTVGVMVVLVDGAPDKSGYRKFNIRGNSGNNDVMNLKEIISRRLGHPEWGVPDLIVVDGGKGQINAVRKVLASAGRSIKVVSVVKDDRHKPKAIMGDKSVSVRMESDILLANAEAHRFALKYHAKVRGKGLLR